MEFNLPLNIQYPNGFILDYIQDEVYMYIIRFHKNGLNLYVGVGKNDFMPHMIYIKENGTNISLHYDKMVSKVKTLNDVFTRRGVVKTFKTLCPEFDFTKDEYTLQYHEKLVVLFKKFQQIVKTTLYRHPNLDSLRAMFWKDIKTLVVNSELLDLASILIDIFKHDCMLTHHKDGEYYISFRHPIMFGQLDYGLAKKTIKEYYTDEKQK